VAKDVRKGNIKVAVHLDLRDNNVRTIRALNQLLCSLPTLVYDLFSIASQEDLSDSLLVMQQLGIWEVPRRVEGLCEGQMLFGDDAPRYPLFILARLRDVMWGQNAYRSQHGGHELVRFLWPHEATHFEHANGEAGYNGRMFVQSLLEYFTVLFIVLERSDFGHAAKAFKGS
jgi:hypothetical protein